MFKTDEYGKCFINNARASFDLQSTREVNNLPPLTEYVVNVSLEMARARLDEEMFLCTQN